MAILAPYGHCCMLHPCYDGIHARPQSPFSLSYIVITIVGPQELHDNGILVPSFTMVMVYPQKALTFKSTWLWVILKPMVMGHRHKILSLENNWL